MAEPNSSQRAVASDSKLRVIVLPDPSSARKPPGRAIEVEPLLTADDVAKWLGVSTGIGFGITPRARSLCCP